MQLGRYALSFFRNAHGPQGAPDVLQVTERFLSNGAQRSAFMTASEENTQVWDPETPKLRGRPASRRFALVAF